MQKGTYSKKIAKCLKELGITSSKREHLGRDTAPAIMDVEEVCGLEQRNMGNWAADVFQASYSKKIPFGALWVLAGFKKEKGVYKNPRTTFKGGVEHGQLSRMIFPWIERILGDEQIHSYETAKAFLVFLRNLRWVILQDAAVLTKVHGRKHILFDSFPNIFKSDLFNDYAGKLLEYLDASFDPNDVDIQTVLPGVLSARGTGGD